MTEQEDQTCIIEGSNQGTREHGAGTVALCAQWLIVPLIPRLALRGGAPAPKFQRQCQFDCGNALMRCRGSVAPLLSPSFAADESVQFRGFLFCSRICTPISVHTARSYTGTTVDVVEQYRSAAEVSVWPSGWYCIRWTFCAIQDASRGESSIMMAGKQGRMECVAERANSALVFLVALLVALPALFSGSVASSVEKPLPFIVLHGIGDECRNQGLYEFTQLLINMSGAVGFCIEIGNGASDSFFMRLDKQADTVCEQVKNISELKDGYNMVGLSQGNVVARAVIEFCDGGPPVNNFVSLGGPHAGTASIPGCTLMSLCKLADALIRLGVYSPFVQNHLAPSGYVKIPNDMDAYYKGSLFLPKLNNEIASNRNETYRKRLESLNHLVLIMFQQDAILIPPQTAWFGYYADNDFTTVQAPEETDLYKEDWIGLRALDESGRVTYLAFPGDHLSINDLEIRDFVVPYLRSSPSIPSWSEY